MKVQRDNPIEEGIDDFFEEKQRLEEEKQKLENENRDYGQKYLDQYYDQLYEQELAERLEFYREFYDDLWSGSCFSDKETYPDKPLIDVTMERR